MLKSIELPLAYRVTPTGLYLISTAHEGKRNVQFAFRSLGLSDDPPLLLIGIQEDNFSREMIQKSREFVVNVCSENQLHAVNRSRDLSGRNVTTSFSLWAWKRAPRNMCKPRSLSAAMPMWNAVWLRSSASRDCGSSSAKLLPLIWTIRYHPWADWPAKHFA
jgi:flavin reductase (DIM6/NTAB) family NADH-FMN oxidoreductase RutF